MWPMKRASDKESTPTREALQVCCKYEPLNIKCNNKNKNNLTGNALL